MLISGFKCHEIERHIQEYENDYKVSFPDQYRNFLMQYNGGETPNTKFRIAKISSDLSGFFGLGNVPKEFHLRHFTDGAFISAGMIPIGKNAFGDYLLTGCNQKNVGAIFFLYHDAPPKFIKLTGSFVDFVSKCESEKLKPCRTIEERIAGRKAAGILAPIPDIALKTWQEEIDRYQSIHQEELIID